MEAIISKLPAAVLYIPIVIVGVAAGMYMLDTYRDKKQLKKDNADDRLNGILEKTVKELSGKVDQLEKREKELTKEVSELRKDNEKYLSILQGRDAQTQEFYKSAAESMVIGKATHELVTATNQNVNKLVEAISEFIKNSK